VHGPICKPVTADCSVLPADCHNKNSRTTDCQSQESKFEGGLPKTSNGHMVFIRSELVGWLSAVSLRAIYQVCITVVTDQGNGARGLAIK
jgi:hypothetical protein